jgi:hypothetical protein
MGPAWIYQGRLIDSNSVADGLYDLKFRLYDDANTITGNQVGGDVNKPDVDVIDGYFTVELDFGSDIFVGDSRWLDIGVRPGDSNDPNAFVTLSPRQEVMPTPNALYAKTSGSDNDWMVSGNDIYSIPSGNIGIGTTSPVDKLHIQAGNLQGLTMEGSGGNVLLRLKENSAGGKNYLLGSSGGTSGLGQGVFTIRDFTTDVVRLRIESNGDTALGGSFGASASSSISGAHIVTKGGNVGIGTTSPQSHVQIDNSLDATGSGASNLALLVRRNSIAAGSGPGIGFCSDNSLAVGAKIVHIRTSSNSKGDLAFYTKSATSGPSTEKMRIKDNGNVGIGTTVPIAKLHVEGGLRVTADGDFLGSFLRTSGNLIANGEIYKQGVDPVYINDDLDVNGKIYQRGTQIHADYVFEPDYKLESIEEHSEFMWQQKHLPAIPKAKTNEMGQEIVEAGSHRRGIVEELEKAHIYIEQLHKRVKTLEAKEAEIAALKKQKKQMQTRLLAIESVVSNLVSQQEGGLK